MAHKLLKLPDSQTKIFLSERKEFMKRKQLVSVLILAGAFMAINPGLTLAQSVGGSQSERTGDSDQTPLPKGGSSGGEGKAGKGATKSQSKLVKIPLSEAAKASELEAASKLQCQKVASLPI
jgi:hypothetical protein